MVYILVILSYMGMSGYQAVPVMETYKTEQACRDAGATSELPEMPSSNTPPATWPKRAWKCKGI
jgi:hypothetical protein